MAIRRSASMASWTQDGTHYILTLDGATTPLKIRKSDNRLQLDEEVAEDAF